MWLVLHGVCATAACCVYALVNYKHKTYLAHSKREQGRQRASTSIPLKTLQP